MKVKKLIEVFNLIEPMFLYIVVVYGITQVYQFVFDVESVWQTFWDKLREILGRRRNYKLIIS